MLRPSVRLGIPDDSSHGYTTQELNGVQIYRHESVNKLGDAAKLEVEVESFLFKKKLTINELA